MLERLTRRSILAGGLSGLAGLALPASRPQRGPQGRVLRVVHLTDVHLKTTGDAPSRFARCLDRIQRNERPDLIFQGGDIVMDALDLDRPTVQSQFDLASRVFRDHTSAKLVHCVGNHDVWAWNRSDKDQLARDPHFGKGWWLDWTGYNSTYFSFDRAGWHFVFLDSIMPQRVRGYQAKIDEAQWQWLQADLNQVSDDTPICVVSHIPILSAAAQFFGPSENSGRRWEISGTLMHLDARRLKDLFLKHPNVRLCLSGHVHMNSHVRYAGVAHVSNGAVSGAWWNGDMQETKPGYGVVDLFRSGHFMTRYEAY